MSTPEMRENGVQYGPHDKSVYVTAHGAAGTGLVDDSAAFVACIAAAEAAIVAGTSIGSSNSSGNCVIHLPPGDYLINSAEALIRSTFATRTSGIRFVGAGRGVTRILFQSGGSGYLCNNNDAWLNVHFQDITFYSNSATQGFMKSTSAGGAQNYSFERVNWEGSWANVFEFEGTNNNSEMSWHHCNCFATVNNFINVPTSPTGSDQFLDYNFFGFNFVVSSGNFLNVNQGGNYNIWGGAFIHYGQAGGTFFNFPVASHGYGVQRLTVQGARMEHRTRASQLCNIQWNNGSVLFESCDMSSSSYISTGDTTNTSQTINNVTNAAWYWTNGDSITGTGIQAGTTVTAVGASSLTISLAATATNTGVGLANLTAVRAAFTNNNANGCSVKFDGCMLMGLHQYTYNASSYSFPHAIVYDNCEFTNFSYPSQFITNIAGGGNTNLGGVLPVEFRKCKSQLDTTGTLVWDGTVNFVAAAVGVATPKWVSLKTAQGQNNFVGYGNLSIVMPLNAVITRVKMLLVAGALGSGAPAEFTLQTTEGSPTVLAHALSITMSSGFDAEQELTWWCTSDTKRTLNLVPNQANQATTQALFLIEYV